MTPTDDHDTTQTSPADAPRDERSSGVAMDAAGESPRDDGGDSLEAAAAEVAAADASTADQGGKLQSPAQAPSRLEKPSYRGEVVFLCVVLVLTMFFSLAGVPGEPEKLVTDGSDALRKGWMEERLLEYHRGPVRPEVEVIVTEDVATDAGQVRSIQGTWLEQALREQDAEPQPEAPGEQP